MFNKKTKINMIQEYDILDRLIKEDTEYERLREYGEMTINVARQTMKECLERDEYTLEDYNKMEDMIYDTMRVASDANKHAYARDVLIEMHKSKMIPIEVIRKNTMFYNDRILAYYMKGEIMAEDTVKNEEVKEEEPKTISDGDKYRQLRAKLMLAGRIALGVGCVAAAGLVAYHIGKGKGFYECLEKIATDFPDVRDALTAIDPAFFAALV